MNACLSGGHEHGTLMTPLGPEIPSQSPVPVTVKCQISKYSF